VSGRAVRARGRVYTVGGQLLILAAGLPLPDHSTSEGPSIAFWRTPGCSSGAVARRTSAAREGTLRRPPRVPLVSERRRLLTGGLGSCSSSRLSHKHPASSLDSF
jgi:hypothetical protein